MNTSISSWLLLIVSLPTQNTTARMRIWRALKALGCGSLRDGAYILPEREILRQTLSELAAETIREGGTAWLLNSQPTSDEDAEATHALFNRDHPWDEMVRALGAAHRTLQDQQLQEINRSLRKLRKDYTALVAIDYFPNHASAAGETAWNDYLRAAQSLLSPGEPLAVAGEVPILDAVRYQHRVWATRRRLWVDRVASAWLIRRFIDPQSSFLWLATPQECPKDAIGFDFDDAVFTHVGQRVTFQVLLASFALETDQGLMRLGAMVHALDVGGAFVPEAAGFEAMLSGARGHAADDDQLLAQMSPVLDALYNHFSAETNNLASN